MKRYLLTTAIAVGLATPALAVETTDVLDTYADIAAANYGDSLITAKALQAAVNALVADPSAENLTAARAAWLGRPCAIPADRGVPFRQCHRR